MDIEKVAHQTICSAIKVHRALGPGLLESVYQRCLAYELERIGLQVKCEVVLPIRYEELCLDGGYRIDMIVEGMIIIENKTVDQLTAVHEAQLLTYLKMSHSCLGFLFNWNVPLLKDGIKRMVNNL